jgi:hypothetical protein
MTFEIERIYQRFYDQHYALYVPYVVDDRKKHDYFCCHGVFGFVPFCVLAS